MHVLTVSGSLRDGSINTALLLGAAEVAPTEIRVDRFDGIGDLPHFNPDLDVDDAPPPPVARWRAALAGADAVLLSTPEYAHGLPGSFKNALDWVVGSGELVAKPVGIVSATSGHEVQSLAEASLVETLTVMSAVVVPGAVMRVPLVRRKVVDGRVTDVATRAALADLLAVLHAAAS